MIKLGLYHSIVFKRTMSSEKESIVTFIRDSSVNLSCLGRCSRSSVNYPSNVNLENFEPLQRSELLIITTFIAIITGGTVRDRKQTWETEREVQQLNGT